MAMTTRARNRLVDALNSLFSSIGTTANTRPPMVIADKHSNQTLIAWELYVANHLYTLARQRRRKAVDVAVEAGVIFNHEKHPREPGTNEQVYEDSNLSITVSVANRSERINSDKLIRYLEDKVDTAVLDAAIKEATFSTRPAHEFTTTIRTE